MSTDHFPEIVKSVAKNALRAIGRQPAVKTVTKLLNPAATAGPAVGISDVRVAGRVAMYFGDASSKLYQVIQWLPVLEELHRKHEVLLIFRTLSAFRAASKLTSLPKVYIRKYADLMDFYDDNDLKLIIYVNNSYLNFQSLEHPRMVHVHVNHGESDKLSMVSNRAKAYDKVFVAGPAAIKRHESMLVDFDFSKLVITGRPQLDIEFEPELEPSSQMDVMYAPTWEGENDDNNYTSIDLYGEEIVDALLANPSLRVIYKPHPRVQGSSDRAVAMAHENIVLKLEEASAFGAKHVVCMEGNILSMFGAADALITDVSSVALDFLYLHPTKPLILSDRRTNQANLHRDAPVSQACQVIDASTIGKAVELLPAALVNDQHQVAREEMRRFYFGDLELGDSTVRFEQVIEQLMMEREQKLSGIRQWHR
ncbi:CDP-glycerol glycerophosphotransferase family protein [Glutamicibacter arilaitensis]|uniref:CDP-glycerol glycerophosphotransferase family protein n=1 Tax=Glutamicibacter arilaitensis TaxID=256701 RepID=UPI00384D089C